MSEPNAEELRLLLIDHMTNMLYAPRPVDVDYGTVLLDRVIQAFLNEKGE